MTEADILALAMSSPAGDFSIPDEVYVGGRGVPRLKKPAAPTVHTVKASLHGAKPPVWRRLELPSELTLDMVHEVLQIAFSWHGYHLHQFAARAAMLRSCWRDLFSDSVWHGQSSAEGETVMVAVDNRLDRRAERLIGAGRSLTGRETEIARIIQFADRISCAARGRLGGRRAGGFRRQAS